MNMINYIEWRGDLTFDLVPLNEVDALIFSTLCYETFDTILAPNNSMTLNQLHDLFFKKYKEEDLKERKSLTARTYELLKACAYTERYGNLILSNFINVIDEQNTLQFSAMTYQYKNKWKYIAFRGTDDTIVGWREDFMLAYKDEILAQKKAREYLEHIFKQQKLFSKPKYYIGGHSKGANLAIYSCLSIPNQMHSQIVEIYSFDGPGFTKSFWKEPTIQALLPKIKAFIPPASFFGRLFEHQEEIKIIKSDQVGLLQHNPLFWHTSANDLVLAEKISEGSNKALNRFNEFMDNYTLKEREQMIESLFAIFKELGISTLEDLTEINFNHVANSLKMLNNLDQNSKKFIRDLLLIIWNVTDLKGK